MKITKVALAVGLFTSPLLQAGEFISAQNPDNAIPNKYIVTFKDSAMQQSLNTGSMSASVNKTVSSLSSQFNAVPVRKFSSALRGAVFEMDETTAMAMANDPKIALVEQDQIVTLSATQNNPTWGLDRVDQRSGSLDNAYTYDTTASNVNVYVIDTGVNNHSDFGGRVYNGYDFIDNDNNSSDCQGHGTHVAGTVASATYGVAKGAKVYGVRVLNCQGSGSNSGIISGMDWVAQNHSKPAVANMSLGGGASS
ncbi:MAG: S8 family serine peptidase, partial [Kangiellaceae bacterium]|nr:S8 family serine peptidase [Kangiellaceae bacterium]